MPARKLITPKVRDQFLAALRAGADMHLAARAVSLETGHVGLTRQAFYKEMKSDESFRIAVNEARSFCDDQIVKRLFDKGMEGDTTAMIFWLKNRQPGQWRDRHDHQVNVDRTERVEYVAVFADGSEIEQPIKEADSPSPPALPN